MLSTTMIGNDGSLCQRKVMFNIVVGKELMVHADKYELQDRTLIEQSRHKDVASGDM